jgi:large subunit ribosomal protein L25
MAYKITAQKREGLGKSVTRKLRAADRIPAVLYGQGKESVSLLVGAEEMGVVLLDPRARSSVITLSVVEGDKAEEKNVLIKEVQRHPVQDFIFHLDFLEVAMDKEISLAVPVELSGTAEGIKMGGILQFMAREIKVACLPSAIPEQIKVDISHLDIGDSVHIRDLAPLPGVRFIFDSNFTIASVVSPAAEEVAAVAAPAEGEEAAAEAAAAAAAVPGAKAEPEVIGRGKKEVEED